MWSQPINSQSLTQPYRKRRRSVANDWPSQRRSRSSGSQPLQQQLRSRQLRSAPARLQVRRQVTHRWLIRLILGLAAIYVIVRGVTAVGLRLNHTPTKNTPTATSQEAHSTLSSSQNRQLQQEAAELFATSNSLGTIALGVAEGTRRRGGITTPHWQHHTDPGNGADNLGTFSWQLGANSPVHADQQGLARIRDEAIPHLLAEAEQEQVDLTVRTLLNGADLWNQAPQAGADFVENLKRCQSWGRQNADAVLCARLEGYVNPQTGQIEAAGFANDYQRLSEDQWRRIQAIERTLEQDLRYRQSSSSASDAVER